MSVKNDCFFGGAQVMNDQETRQELSQLSSSPGLFITANIECAKIFPLQLSDVRPQRPEADDLSQVIVDDIPK